MAISLAKERENKRERRALDLGLELFQAEMPPKKVSMKFKPKLVKSKQSDDFATADATEEEVARRQRERIQKLQQELNEHTKREEIRPFSSPAVNGHDAASHVATHRGESAPGKRSLLNGAASSGSDLFNENGTVVDFFSCPRAAVPLTTPALPANTLYSALSTESATRDMYPPVALTSSSSQNSSSCSAAKTTEASPNEGPSSSTAIQDDATAGTSFLCAREVELQASYRNNQFFVKNVVEPSTQSTSDPNGCPSSLVWIQLPRFRDASVMGGGGAHPPRHQGKAEGIAGHERISFPTGTNISSSVPFDLRNLPPGKIGEVKLYRSGRMTMNINGCCFDLLAEGSEQAEGTTPGAGGGCSLAAFTTIETEKGSVSSTPTGEVASPQSTCYLLDILQHKLVAVPTTVESSSS